MYNRGISLKSNITAVIRTMLILALFTAVLLFSRSFVFAEDAGITVQLKGETVRSFSMEELQQIAAEEGDLSYVFSGWNTFPTYRKFTVKGPTIRKLLEEAGVINDVTDTGTVTFSDGVYKVSLTGAQLFGEKRYCYPQGNLVDPIKGIIPAESYDGATGIEAVLSIGPSNEDPTLYIGQVAPNEENRPAFVHYLKYINISTLPAPVCGTVESVPASGSVCGKGSEIILKGNLSSQEYIYYTWDESAAPDYGSVMYNSGANQGIDTIPVLPDKYGIFHLSVKVKGYGKQDGDVQVFEFKVLPDAPVGVKAVPASYHSAKVTWNGTSDASGYRIYRALGSGTPVFYKEVGPGVLSLTDTNLNTGTAYTYQITSIVDQYGTSWESPCSLKVSARPALTKPTVKLTARKKQVTVKWSKVSGASGYVIYRSTKKSSGFKAVKTIKSGKTVKFVNKKLKKDKKYYFKVRAYRTVSGKKVYGSYSAVKAAKAK